MSDPYVDQAKDQQHVLERLIKGLPGLRGYADKELRRNADYQVRQMVADELDRSRNALYDVQNQLLKSGGLSFMDDVDFAIGSLQTLADRVRTASYGYTGIFDPVKVEEQQLQALRAFDIAMLDEVSVIEAAIAALRGALGDKSAIPNQIDIVTRAAMDLSTLFDRRSRAIQDPTLLLQSGYTPSAQVAANPEVSDAPDAPDAGDQ